ncbi:MAG: SCO family protein [Gemmatimonadaceae bacterium]|nr:SCO family protein [Gemmatimonadaceae bacterium]
MRRRFLLLVALAAGLACDRGAMPGREAASAFRGVLLTPPLEKPDFTFTDVNGQPWNLRVKTAGKVALLFFGYTHCPDVCPLHAANVAAVLRTMPFEVRDKVMFLFVTTDPARDTPERLKEWLAAFDPTFVGLTAPPEALGQLQVSLGIAPARIEIPPGADSANYLVGHGAQVIAFGLDDQARIEYPFGIRQEDWANDLPRLARGEVPTSAARTGPPPATIGAANIPEAPPIEVRAALMAAPVSTSEASIYLVVQNNGEADTLTGVWSPDAASAAMHATRRDGGTMRMEHVASLPLAPGARLELLPGGTHVMLMGLTRKPIAGESFPLRLRFARAGEYVIAPMVVAYADLDAQLTAARQP